MLRHKIGGRSAIATALRLPLYNPSARQTGPKFLSALQRPGLHTLALAPIAHHGRTFSTSTGSEARGPSASRSIRVVSADDAEKILRLNEFSRTQNGVASGFHFSVLASNSPCEDQASYDTIGGRQYYAVFDGHAGDTLSRVLSGYLIPHVAKRLESVSGPSDVARAIRSAFVEVDQEIVRLPLDMLEGLKSGTIADGASIEAVRKQARVRWQLAQQGSCALLAIFDEATQTLHVACTGDSRAVMGTWDAKTSQWRTRVLTEDQTSANPREARRLQSEHPPGEAKALVEDGRTVGLGMSRAFGDSMFKWSPDEIRTSSKAFRELVIPYKDCKTPPYVTAEPVVTSIPVNDSHGRKFVVLASDGVYEWLSNQEIVALVGGWLDGLKGTHDRASVLARTSMDEHPADMHLPPPFPGPRSPPHDFLFTDSNVATHVIRNAFAGDNTLTLQFHLSLRPGISRQHRDDMTVMIVMVGDAGDVQGSADKQP
ncbi:protein serine/threonine phosphatase 2C [Exidia glandulosa HHB12029]|uniref:Protein serine/threonine phosphatase 2C n=1 Tax=Exidia glandulosa HHB12029 TaxID=1314781 RepID=A0A165LT45_EXIGL|nr:protein serine/threonine phosphatase 2C [Exidia glandulosa HHB12029]